jgi:hypothetical protein
MVKLKHWCGRQGKNIREAAPVLVFYIRMPQFTPGPFVVSLLPKGIPDGTNHKRTALDQQLASRPFDKLRANGRFLEVPIQ